MNNVPSITTQSGVRFLLDNDRVLVQHPGREPEALDAAAQIPALADVLRHAIGLQHAAEQPVVVVAEVDGGVVSVTAASRPAQVIVLDTDLDGIDPAQICEVPSSVTADNFFEATVAVQVPQVRPDYVAQVEEVEAEQSERVVDSSRVQLADADR